MLIRCCGLIYDFMILLYFLALNNSDRQKHTTILSTETDQGTYTELHISNNFYNTGMVYPYSYVKFDMGNK